MKDKVINILLYTKISLNVLFTVYLSSFAIYTFCFNQLDVKEYEYVNLNIPRMEYTLTKQEIRQLVKNLYKTPHFYKETSKIKKGRMAENYAIIRYVRIRDNLSLREYAVAYAHELTHIKFSYGDETMTTFKTFVMLYESGHPELQHMALVDAKIIIDGCYRGTEYDCGFYILRYLKENNYGNLESYTGLSQL